MSGTCAICADESDDLVLEPLGRDDALVRVCVDCRTEPSVHRRGPERGFEPQGSASGLDQSLVATYQRIPKLAQMARADFRGGLAPAKTGVMPGWIRVLIPKRDDRGRVRDQHQAWLVAKAQWGPDVRSVAATGGKYDGYFVFQRPDRAALAKLRNGTAGDPIAALEPYRRKERA